MTKGVCFLCSAPMCTKTFTSQVRLRNHFEAKHKPIEPTPLPPPQNVKVNPKPSKEKELSEENVQNQKEMGSIREKEKEAIVKISETCDEQVQKVDPPHPKVETYMKQHAEKSMSGKNAPGTQNTTRVSTQDNDWYDSDPDFNNEKLPHPSTENDDWFERLAKAVQVPGSNNIVFKCRKCTKSSCTRRADLRCHWQQYCPVNKMHVYECAHCKPTKYILYGKSNLLLHLQTKHSLSGEHMLEVSKSFL